MSRIREIKRRHRAAHLGDYHGDNITWRVKVVGNAIIARELGNPEREIVQSLPEWLAEKAGFAGKTQVLKGGGL